MWKLSLFVLFFVGFVLSKTMVRLILTSTTNGLCLDVFSGIYLIRLQYYDANVLKQTSNRFEYHKRNIISQYKRYLFDERIHYYIWQNRKQQSSFHTHTYNFRLECELTIWRKHSCETVSCELLCNREYNSG